MRALIVGLGSIGRRHLANIRQMAPEAFITVWRQYTKPQDGAALPDGANRVVYSLGEALDPHPDLALVTGPASLHVSTALALAKAGVHLFVEKPLSHSLEGVEELIELCERNKLVLHVGYNFRFYEPLRRIEEAIRTGRVGKILSIRAEVGQYLPDWRPGSDYRKTVTAQKALGGGALLELSHEIDYVRWLAGEVETVTAQTARLSDLEIDVEDTAEVILRFKNGAIGNIHLDLVQRAYSRSCRIIGSAGTITWDSSTHHVQLYDADARAWTDLHPAGPIERNTMYTAELNHFISCIEKQNVPVVTGEDGREVLKIALAAHQAARTGQMVAL